MHSLDLTYYIVANGYRQTKAAGKQAWMWVATQDLPRNVAHPFYTRRKESLDRREFDGFVDGLGQRFTTGCGRLAYKNRAR